MRKMSGVYYNSPQDTPEEQLRWEVGFPSESRYSKFRFN